MRPAEIRALVKGRELEPIREYAIPPPLSMPFIDRNKELSAAWCTLLKSRRLSKDAQEKQTMLVTGQMFGSGKTAFGENLFNFDDAHIEKLFNEIMGSFGALKEEVQVLRAALTVRVDLQQHVVTSSGPKDLNTVLSLFVWRCTLMRFEGVTEMEADALWHRHRPTDLKSCVTTLTTALDRPLFLHFDEVGAIEDDQWTSLVGGGPAEPTGVLRRYYKF